jgi:phosphatidate phosphatase PAH1
MTFKKSTILSPQQDVSTFLQSKDKSSASTVSTVSTASTSSHLSDESSYSVSERSEPQSSTSQRSKSKGSAHVAISRLPSRVKTSKFSSIHSSARSNSDLKLHKRNPHTVLVSQNKDTGLWMTKTETMTNSKNLIRPVAIHKSEHDAVQYAIANAPPKLVSCEESKRCFQCDFMLHSRRRQAVNCRNCGVCICSSCSVSWNRTMVPSTFLAKNSPNKINVCKTCDYLATEFRHALLDGSLKYAKKLYETNNINLRCPLSNLKNGIEIM